MGEEIDIEIDIMKSKEYTLIRTERNHFIDILKGICIVLSL